MSKIEWTDVTWNPIVGCRPVSPGCANCYAARMATRLVNMEKPGYVTINDFGEHEDAVAGRGKWTGVVRCLPGKADEPLRWRKPRKVFVGSMTDIFHDDVPDDFLDKIFETMELADRHTFQVLTKRPAKMRDYLDQREVYAWPPKHIWVGTSVEDRRRAEERIPVLRATRPDVRFLSCEPLLGPLGPLDLNGIGWVIAGGESGPKARPMEGDWVREIRDQCAEQGVPFFFKQWGGRQDKGGHLLDGVAHREFPR